MTSRLYLVWLILAAAPLLDGQQYMISTIAGNGSDGFSGDGGPAPAAQLGGPGSVAVDAKGNIYIADGENNVIRMVSGGTITTVAGNGTAGYAGDGASATNAELNSPSGVAVDSSGNLYIADTGNNVIRKVSGGNISTYAGNIQNNGNGQSYGGDGGPATAIGVMFAAPSAVALDSSGNLYISDSGNSLVRKVSGGNINALVGINSTATKIMHPLGLALDAAGNLYIADPGTKRVAKFSTNGTLTTLAGNNTTGFSGDNNQATSASLNNPSGVAVDAAGNIYIADSFNSRIRRVAPNGIITTIAGNGRINYTGDGGLSTLASLNFPKGVTVDSKGNIYIADTSNNVIRLLLPAVPTISDGSVGNAASMALPLSAGQVATLSGVFLSNAPGLASPPYPATLAGVTVMVNGTAAPIQSVSSTQVNFQVPWETTGTTANIVLMLNNLTSNTETVPLSPAGPGLFVDVNGNAIAQNADGSTNAASNPAQVGTTITAMMTGTGPVAPTIADGAAPSDNSIMLTLATTATIGGEATPVISANLAPGMVGVAQFTIMVPSDLQTGPYPLVLGVGSETSNAGTISVTQ